MQFSDACIMICNCVFNNNGYFGKVLDEDPTSKDHETSEIANGAAIKILQSTSVVPLNITVESCEFTHNRGRSGGAVNIDVSQPVGIKFNNVSFLDNSVVQYYVNSSALFVLLSNTSFAQVQLSKCSFTYNNGGRNMIGYIVAGELSDMLINNCKFMANTEYNVSLIELDMQSQSNAFFKFNISQQFRICFALCTTTF